MVVVVLVLPFAGCLMERTGSCACSQGWDVDERALINEGVARQTY